MKFADVSSGVGYEILATNNYNAIPKEIAPAADATTTVVKAGMPITEAGVAVPAGTGAIGVLLYDVDTAVNPNAAIVVSGVVDWDKCQLSSGATATAATMQAAVPAIKFRTGVGATAFALSTLAAATVTRNGQILTTGATIYAGEQLTITPAQGATLSVNGVTTSTVLSVIVTGDVTITLAS